MKLTLLPRRQSGSRSDKRLEGRGIETRDAQRTLWSHSHGTVAQCTRKHTASESHKVPLQHGWTKPKLRTRTRASLDRTTPEEGGSPRPRAFLLSERDPLCRRGSATTQRSWKCAWGSACRPRLSTLPSHGSWISLCSWERKPFYTNSPSSRFLFYSLSCYISEQITIPKRWVLTLPHLRACPPPARSLIVQNACSL